MPKPQHARVTFSGVFQNGAQAAEIWSWGLTYGYVASLHATTSALATTARTAYAARIAGLMPSDVILTKTRVSLHQAGGKVTVLEDGSFDQGDDLTAVPGSASRPGGRMPLQTALCVSFTSRHAGPTGKGRAFLPMPSFSIGSDYRIAATDAAQLANAMRNLCQGLTQATDSTTQFLLTPPFTFVSSTTSPGLGPHAVVSSKGYSSAVVDYRVGLVPDTMRSRRNALIEDYAHAS